MRPIGFEIANHCTNRCDCLLSSKAALLPLLLQKQPPVSGTRTSHDQGTLEIPNDFTSDTV